MRFYKFAKIAARNFPTVADLNNPWIFSEDVAVVINVSQFQKPEIVEMIKAKGIEYFHLPLNEEVADIGWENIKQAVTILLQKERGGKRIIVHCDFGQHRSRVVIEAFHYAKFAEHFADEYKGYNNHLIYNCQTQHLPDLQTIETQLCNLQQFM